MELEPSLVWLTLYHTLSTWIMFIQGVGARTWLSTWSTQRHTADETLPNPNTIKELPTYTWTSTGMEAASFEPHVCLKNNLQGTPYNPYANSSAQHKTHGTSHKETHLIIIVVGTACQSLHLDPKQTATSSARGLVASTQQHTRQLALVVIPTITAHAARRRPAGERAHRSQTPARCR